ncbi:hypothetical protein ACLX1H_001758 [Fusarium chlamydosporum]
MASSPNISNRVPAIIVLSILTIFGLDALLLQLERNGYMDMARNIISDPLPRFLPDTDRLILKRYTGIGPLDDFFAFSNIVWAGVTDGSRPELSLFTFCFGGQLIATFMVFIIESQRTVGWSPLVLKQWSNAVWSMAPFYIFILQIVFTGLLKRLSVGQDAYKPKVVLDKAALRHAYGFAWNIAVVSQMTTYAVLIAASVLPGIFPNGLARSFTISKVFAPGAPPHSYEPMSSAAVAMHNFLIYDFATGSVAGLVWGLQQLLEVKPELKVGEERANLARGVVKSVLLSGPGGALIALMQHRDESVLSAEAKAEKTK